MKRLSIIILLVVILAACGGDESDPSSPTSGAVIILESTDTPAPQGPPLAALVNDQPITLEALELETTRQATMGSELAADAETFKTEVLERMIDQALIEQYALANNLVSDEEVQAEIAALTQEAAAQEVALADLTGYPDSMTEEKVREALYTRAVIEALTIDPVTQVHARHILLKNQEAALDIIAQLDGGADFAELAEEFSKDGSTAPAGGDLGWLVPGELFQPEVEEIIFSMPTNSRWPEPVSTALGYHVVEVLEHDADRPLTPEQQFKYEQHAIRAWLQQQRASATIERYVGNNAG